MEWKAVDDGATIGRTGFANGTILRDEQLEGTARITLEELQEEGSFTITASLSGWFDHAHTVTARGRARQEFEEMKSELTPLVDSIPFLSDPESEHKIVEVTSLVRRFMERFA